MHSHPSHLQNKGIDPHFRKNQRRSIGFLMLLGVLLTVFFFVCLGCGSYRVPVSELLAGIFGLAADSKINLVVQSNRLPRVLAAVLAGGGLGLAGCILQAVLHNPLASASTLGVSQGAGFGAALAVVVLGMGSGGIGICAFAGSLAVALVILALSRFKNVSAQGIVLAGVAISAMFTGATTLIQYFANEVELSTIVFWTFGDLGGADWKALGQMAAVFFLLFAYGTYHRWDYNALLSGEETAISLGIPVKRLTIVSLLLCCLTGSVTVAQVGLINFIGLAAPHIVRLAVGSNHKYLLPGSAMTGALLLLLGDLLARTAIAPAVLPIGAITSFLGGPLFLYLLFRGGKEK